MASPPNHRPSAALRILRQLLAIYLALVVLVYLVQRRLMYFPMASAVPAPDPARYPGLQTIELQSADGLRLFSWHWPAEGPVTLVIFHGNAGNRLHRLDWIEDLHRLGLGVFLLDYRGYGGSEGHPSEEGFYRDAEAAIDWLETQGVTNLVYFGESIGCGVAIEMARRRPPKAVILQSGYTATADVAAKSYFFLPVRLLVKDRFENAKKLKDVTSPVLVIHGEKDREIPISHGRGLFEAAKEPKEWLSLAEAGHNDVPDVGGNLYYEAIHRFVTRHL